VVDGAAGVLPPESPQALPDEIAGAGMDALGEALQETHATAGEDSRPAAFEEAALAELEVRLASASLDLTDRLLHSAFQEMEAAMFEQVSNRLRAELPDLVARIIREHFDEHLVDEQSGEHFEETS
jgi:hypothetical protein